jgi:DNA-binding NarL/FixJ family response regulator
MMINLPPIRLVFADDFAMTRSLMRMFLQTDPQIVILGEAANGDMLLTLCNTVQPTIVLMDYRMPGPGTPALVRWIHDHHPDTKIIIVSSEEAETHLRPLAQLGVEGYVLKYDIPDCLLEAIHSVNMGMTWYSPKIRSLLTTSDSTP